MPQARAVDAVMIYAADPEALSRFYATALGVRSERSAQDGNYYGEVGEEARATHFGIYPGQAGAGRGRVMVNYRVDDIDAAVRELEALGVAITRREDASDGRFAYFDDPEGNPVEIWARP